MRRQGEEVLRVFALVTLVTPLHSNSTKVLTGGGQGMGGDGSSKGRKAGCWGEQERNRAQHKAPSDSADTQYLQYQSAFKQLH